MNRRPIGIVVVLAACTGGSDSDTDPGACGAVTTHDLTVLGRVQHATGAAAGGATVQLVDEGWDPGTVVGLTTTDSSGAFSLDAVGVTSVEGCWGTLLDYRLTATDAAAAGERQINQALYAAIEDGSLEVDLRSAPLVIE